jgi:acetyl esterase/lipase
MNTIGLVDPALCPLLDAMPTDTLSAETLPALREREFPMPASVDCGVSLETISVPSPGGAPEILLHIYRPDGERGLRPCIYHIHGGGFVAGSAKQFESIHRPLCAELDCVIVSVDYRLAPETVFPGAIEDCYAGLAWTIANAHRLGIDTARIGVMGESAGGGLAAALALLARDRGELELAFQVLIYPMIDDRTCVGEANPFAGEFIWTAHNNHFGWSSLLGHDPGGQDVSPYAAVARAADLSNLPPTFISTGALDLFVDEDSDYAIRLIRAGVPTEFHVYPGAFHGFDLMPDAEIAVASRRDTRAALSRFLS